MPGIMNGASEGHIMCPKCEDEQRIKQDCKYRCLCCGLWWIQEPGEDPSYGSVDCPVCKTPQDFCPFNDGHHECSNCEANFYAANEPNTYANDQKNDTDMGEDDSEDDSDDESEDDNDNVN